MNDDCPISPSYIWGDKVEWNGPKDAVHRVQRRHLEMYNYSEDAIRVFIGGRALRRISSELELRTDSYLFVADSFPTWVWSAVKYGVKSFVEIVSWRTLQTLIVWNIYQNNGWGATPSWREFLSPKKRKQEVK